MIIGIIRGSWLFYVLINYNILISTLTNNTTSAHLSTLGGTWKGLQ